jgi:hypothetical protein
MCFIDDAWNLNHITIGLLELQNTFKCLTLTTTLGFKCRNPNVGFAIKCGVQGHMRPRECVWVWNTLSQMGENARDGSQCLANALPLWELHLCRSPKCLEPWLEKQTNTILGPYNTMGKVLRCRCLKCPLIVHLDLIYMNYDQKKGQESNWEFDSQSRILWSRGQIIFN